MNPDTYAQYRLQEAITRREGMIAENKQREHLGQSMAYSEEQFESLANEILIIMRELL